MRSLCSALLGGLVLAGAAAGAGAASDGLAVTIQEWTVPWSSTRPRDPDVAADGAVWFVGQGGDYLGRLIPGSGEFKRIDLPAGTGPHNVVVGPEQRLWVAGNRNARVIRVFPDSGRQTSYKLPDNKGDPHTQQFGPDGYLWFTMQQDNAIGRLDTKLGSFRIINLPTPNARPYGLKIADDGRIWFTEFGTNKLARLDPDTLKVREYALPREAGRPRRLEIADDGSIWYVDYMEGYLGRLDPQDGAFREWRTPGGEDALPYGMAQDDSGRLWFVETGPAPNRLIAFYPASEQFVANEPIASGGGSVRHMVFDRDRNCIWFGTDTNTIGQARIGR